MATYTVDTLSDVTADDGVTTLREAIEAANGAAGADDIEFAAGIAGGTVQLTQGQLLITDSLGIQGGGTVIEQTVNGQRVLETDAGGGQITLDRLTVTNGDSDRGGGILAEDSDLTIANSTISGNSAFTRGSGIYVNGGSLTIDSSTISGNGSSQRGGGAYIRSATTIISNSTISGNRAGEGGGLLSVHGSVTIDHSTISGNDAAIGGGLHGSQTAVTVRNTILAGNGHPQAPNGDIHLNYGSSLAAASSNNLFGQAVVNGSDASDLLGVNPAAVFAAIGGGGGVLGDNGGPTQTIALLDDPDNPALAGGADLGFTTDQRGEARPDLAGTSPDIGAYELDQTVDDCILGTAGNDLLVGTGADDCIRADDGNDLLFGKAGDDEVYGEAGKDALFGNGGDDLLNGGEDSDAVAGGGGNDLMVDDDDDNDVYTGGFGMDIFALTNTAAQTDLILDYTLKGSHADKIAIAADGDTVLFGRHGRTPDEVGDGDQVDVRFGRYELQSGEHTVEINVLQKGTLDFAVVGSFDDASLASDNEIFIVA